MKDIHKTEERCKEPHREKERYSRNKGTKKKEVTQGKLRDNNKSRTYKKTGRKEANREDTNEIKKEPRKDTKDITELQKIKVTQRKTEEHQQKKKNK